MKYLAFVLKINISIPLLMFATATLLGGAYLQTISIVTYIASEPNRQILLKS